MIDSLGGLEKDHQLIVRILKENWDIDAWWQQTITVEYEQARGKRKPHQMSDGFHISKSKTITAPAVELYNAWTDNQTRRIWLDDPGFIIRKANPEKSIRITWVDGESHVNVYFYPKNHKTQVSINHGKLPDAQHADKMKKYWAKQLQQLSDQIAK